MQGALHFVRFIPGSERYQCAVRVFGEPDFLHRQWDTRAVCEIAPGDVVVFAQGDEHQSINPYTYDDSAYQ